MKTSRKENNDIEKFLNEIILIVNMRKALEQSEQSKYCQCCENKKSLIDFSKPGSICDECETRESSKK